MKISVIGSTGWVGRSMVQLFPDAYQYTSHIGTKEDVNKTDVCFVCVPSPLKDGKLNTLIVEEIVKWCQCNLIVIRSTLNVGDCDRWVKKYNKPILHQAEYLGETPNHPLLDEKKTPFIIIGGLPNHRRQLIELYTTVYNANIKIREVSLIESELIKLSENRAIAFKMMQVQELYDVCEEAGINYYTIREAVYGDDPRFNRWFTFIYKDKRGFNNSKCLKKDVPAWCAFAESLGYDPQLTKALVKKSNEYEKNNNQ